jgi:outer membrane lipoprotein carrier protein
MRPFFSAPGEALHKPARRIARAGAVRAGLPLLLAAAAGALALPSSPSSAAPEVPSSAAAVVQRAQARYDATGTLQAAFTQEMRIESSDQVIRSAGKVYFSKPGRMRWEYLTPEPQTIVADGKKLWIDQPADKQVLKAPLQQAFQSRTPVSFLLGVARLERDFNPTLLPPGQEGSVRLKLESKGTEDAAVGTLTLDLDPVTFDIRAATIRDSLGNTTRVALVDVQRNQPLDGGLFEFHPPAGADVIESPGR